MDRDNDGWLDESRALPARRESQASIKGGRLGQAKRDPAIQGIPRQCWVAQGLDPAYAGSALT